MAETQTRLMQSRTRAFPASSHRLVHRLERVRVVAVVAVDLPAPAAVDLRGCPLPPWGPLGGMVPGP